MNSLTLVLVRHTPTPDYTLGTIYAAGVGPLCFCVEDCDRLLDSDVKVPGNTAIPTGRYEVILNYSPRFGRTMPRVLDVPGFTGILIHPGNVPAHTAGCILPVTRLALGSGAASREACRVLTSLMKEFSQVHLEVRRSYDEVIQAVPRNHGTMSELGEVVST